MIDYSPQPKPISKEFKEFIKKENSEYLKKIFLALIVSASFFFLCYLLIENFVNIKSISGWTWVYLAIWWSIGVNFFIYFSSLATKREIILWSIIFGLVSSAPLIWSVKLQYFAGLFIINSVLFLISGLKIQIQNSSQIIFQWARLANSGYGLMSLVLLLLLSVTFYTLADKTLLIKENINGLLKASSPIVRTMISGFSYDLTIDNFLINYIKNREEYRDIVSRTPVGLNEAEKQAYIDQVINQSISEIKKSLISLTKQALNGTESLGEVLTLIISNNFFPVYYKDKNIYDLISTAFLFFVFWGILAIFNILSKFIGWLILEFLLITKFLKIQTLPAEKEVLS